MRRQWTMAAHWSSLCIDVLKLLGRVVGPIMQDNKRGLYHNKKTRLCCREHGKVGSLFLAGDDFCLSCAEC